MNRTRCEKSAALNAIFSRKMEIFDRPLYYSKEGIEQVYMHTKQLCTLTKVCDTTRG